MTACVSFLHGLVEGKGSSIVRRLTEDRRGVTAIEYGLIAALVAIAAIAAMTTLGTSLTERPGIGQRSTALNVRSCAGSPLTVPHTEGLR